jgi:hypothetical protein
LSVGRPKSDRPYRKNLIRVSTVEDMLNRIMEQLHPNSHLRKIIKEELTNLIIKENQKVITKSFNKINKKKTTND